MLESLFLDGGKTEEAEGVASASGIAGVLIIVRPEFGHNFISFAVLQYICFGMSDMFFCN